MTASRRARPAPSADADRPKGIGRRGFLGWVLAAPTLVVGVPAVGAMLGEDAAGAAVLSPPEPSDLYDLTDLLTDATLPTSLLVKVGVQADGTITYALPRAEVGQGLTTAVAMIIADELDVPLQQVDVRLSDARPELVWNQLTGGPNSIHSLYRPLRTAAAVARNRLMAAAAAQWGVSVDQLSTSKGVVYGPLGRSASYGSLSAAAATDTTTSVQVELKDADALSLIGTARSRIDALEAVTGRKRFTMDLQVPDALPTMVHRLGRPWSSAPRGCKPAQTGSRYRKTLSSYSPVY